MPDETIVENWRVMIVSSSALTFLKRSKMSPPPLFCSSMSTTIRPRERSCDATATLSSASISPWTVLPVGSRALYANVDMRSCPSYLGGARRTKQAPQFVRRARPCLGQLARDDVTANELGQRRVHRLHAEARAGLDRRIDLVRLALADQVAHCRRRHQHLGREHATLAVSRWQQLLGGDTLKRDRQLHAHLVLLRRWEHVDDSVDGLGAVLRVQRGEHQVAGFSGRQRRRDRLEVAHLADQDDVRVLAQRCLQAKPEALSVGADLALVDDAALVRVQELDRVLDREDVLVALGVDQVDHRRERGRLTRAGRAGDEHEPARLLRELLEHRRHAEVLELGHARGDQAESGADRGALIEVVDAEAVATGNRVREVDLPVVLETLALLL